MWTLLSRISPRRAGAALLLAFLPWGGGCSAPPYPKDQDLALAQVAALLEKGDLRGAEAEARWVMETHPGAVRPVSVWALAAKALALSRVPPDQDLLDEAEAACGEAARTAPSDPAPLYALGVVRRDRGDLTGAIHSWEDALKVEPFHGPTLEALADLQFSLGHERAAAVLYDRLLRLPPASTTKEDRATFLHRLGVCLLADVELALRPEPDDYDEAEKNFRRALDLAPGHPGASRALAWLVVRRSRLLGRWKEPDLRMEDARRAQAFLRKALELHPRHAGCLHDLGWLRQVCGETKKAEALYRKALALDPKNVPALVDLAALLERRGKEGRAQAARLRKRALELTGDFGLARALRRALARRPPQEGGGPAGAAPPGPGSRRGRRPSRVGGP